MANDKTMEGLSTAALAMLVDVLAAHAGGKELRDQVGVLVRKYADPLGVWSSLLDGAGASEVRDLAYGIASIQIQALTDLTKQSEAYSKAIAGRLSKAAKPPRAAGEAADLDRLVVCTLAAQAGIYTGRLEVPVEIDKLPKALLVRALEGGSEFPVTAEFAPLVAAPNIKDVFAYAVTLGPDTWIEKGKYYKALLPIKGDHVVFFKIKGA